jgi:MSHA pilin protein MshC
VRVHRLGCRGFTLVELIAAITIVAILAAVTLPRMTAATPYAARGYADGIAASLRQARAVALASGCDVQFTINALGYRALQHSAAGTHCAPAGAWVTPVQRGSGGELSERQPAGVALAAARVIVFTAPTGNLAGPPVNIDVAPHRITVDSSGLVQGP